MRPCYRTLHGTVLFTGRQCIAPREAVEPGLTNSSHLPASRPAICAYRSDSLGSVPGLQQQIEGIA